MNAYFVERVCEELGDLAMRMTSHMGMEKNVMNQTIRFERNEGGR